MTDGNFVPVCIGKWLFYVPVVRNFLFSFLHFLIRHINNHKEIIASWSGLIVTSRFKPSLCPRFDVFAFGRIISA